VLVNGAARLDVSGETGAQGDLYTQAEAFLGAVAGFGFQGADEAWLRKRWAAVRAELDATGTYVHSRSELTFGARLAWYHSNRCIARSLWRTLKVFDARHVSAAPDVVQCLERHVSFAFNRGRIRSAVTVFPPRSSGPDPVRVGNHQLMGYAGFRGPDGRVIGDPRNAAFTAHCLERGWTPSRRDSFTPLPWALWISGTELPPRDVFLRRPDLFPEVPLFHPEAPFLSHLGLRWYAVPVLADMALIVGGIVYPCAPFNGFYMGTEIGARNLADKARYDALPAIAEGFGWDTEDERTLWRDRAVVELNRAVLHSFEAAGVRMGDHHAVGAAFAAFCDAEEKMGRKVTGDWSWLVPPLSGALSPVFHQAFDSSVCVHTNYFLQPPPGA